MNIYVGGVNGVGKSTILRRVTQLDHDFEIIHFASALMQQLGLPPGSYDALHAVPQANRRDAATIVIEQLAARPTRQIRLIDGHYLVSVWGNIYPLAQDWIAQMDALMLITASSSVVWRRIEQDEAYRDRELFPRGMSDTDSRQFLTDYISQTEHCFDQLVHKYDQEHFTLDHSSDDVDRATKQIITFVKALKS